MSSENARPSDVEALKHIAMLGGLDDAVELASQDLGHILGLSQQTASRRLIELADEGLIVREMGVRRQRVRITPAGRSLLWTEHLVYQQLFAEQRTLVLAGTVKGGLGEGRYYISRPGYQERFQKALGWRPYPGTLNLELGPIEANKLAFLRRSPVHLIESFQAEGRTFGAVTCHPAQIGELACATILPHRTHYTTTLEVIAPQRLRDAIPCADGDLVTVRILLRQPPQEPGRGAA